MPSNLLRIALFVICSLALSSAALAAPIEIVVQRDPIPQGAMYGWSLRMTVQSGYNVGAVALVATGDTDFQFNSPFVSVAYSLYIPASQWDGVKSVVIIQGDNPALINAPASNVFLGRWLSPYATTPQFSVGDGEYDIGGTVFDPNFNNYPVGTFSIRVVPEPGAFALTAFALALAGLRRRRIFWPSERPTRQNCRP